LGTGGRRGRRLYAPVAAKRGELVARRGSHQSAFEMLLAADFVGLGDVLLELAAELGGVAEFEGVDVVSGGDGLDLEEAGAWVALGEDEMAAEVAAAGHERGEGHPDLEGDAGFFGKDEDGAVGAGGFEEGVEEAAGFGGLAFEVRIEGDVGAEVGLVFVGEAPVAHGAGPEVVGGGGHGETVKRAQSRVWAFDALRPS
jgi:hypothetical protein